MSKYRSHPCGHIPVDSKPHHRFTARERRILQQLADGSLPKAKEMLRRPDVALRKRIHHGREYQAHNKVLWLMATSALASDHLIALALARCTREQPCRSPVCWLCKHVYAERQRRRAAKLFGCTPAHRLAWVTIITDLVRGSLFDVERAIHLGKGRIRDAIRNGGSDFKAVRWLGQVEVDHVPASGVLQRYKQQTIQYLDRRPDAAISGQLVHVHMIVDMGGISRQRLGRRLREVFPGPRRVKVTPLHGNRSKEENLSRLVGYMTKCLPFASNGQGGNKRKFATIYEQRLLMYHVRMLHHFGGLAGMLSFSGGTRQALQVEGCATTRRSTGQRVIGSVGRLD